MTVILDLTISLDGFVAGPNVSLEQPLGEGGEQLHEWLFNLASWRARHGLDGGEETADDAMHQAAVQATGAFVMGRRMFSGGEGLWATDPNADSWFGDEPPFHLPVFVVTHHRREPLVRGETTFFFAESVEAAVADARQAAGGKTVTVAGGADVARQALDAGLLDELQIHIAPVLLGDGVRLFDGATPAKLELTGVVEAPRATHVAYRPVR